jgi:protein-S-isoprenylcysteine O-methyltransferase Ste14
MDDLNQALGGLLKFLITLAGLVFLAAWTLDYWASVGISRGIFRFRRSSSFGSFFMRYRVTVKIIQIVAMVSFISAIVFPALDHRFGWSAVPASVAIAGDILVALGWLVIFFVFKENSFTSGVIEVDTDQKVVSTGPYALVRHPMYSGALIMLAGVPLALGSWWGLVPVVLLALAIIWRLLDEEKFLAGNLPGYSEYQEQVRYRLVPLVW